MDKNWKELVLARYRCIPHKYRINNYTIPQCIREIEQETEFGNLLVKAEREFLQGGLLKLVEEDSLLTS